MDRELPLTFWIRGSGSCRTGESYHGVRTADPGRRYRVEVFSPGTEDLIGIPGKGLGIGIVLGIVFGLVAAFPGTLADIDPAAGFTGAPGIFTGIVILAVISPIGVFIGDPVGGAITEK